MARIRDQRFVIEPNPDADAELAKDWWRAARLSKHAPMPFRQLDEMGTPVIISKAEAQLVIEWARALPGWYGTPPDPAKTPIVVRSR